jgi:Transglutaminase-like superfamily
MRLKDAKTYVKPPDNVDDVRTTRGNTSDIIDTIMFADRFEAQRHLTKDLAERLRGATDFETCRNVWEFVKKQIKYKIDEAGYERVKSSNKTIYDGFGDCKSFTILEISLLRELGITCKYKFVSWQAGQPVTHVYAVAIVDNKEILLDAVHTKFNDEVAYALKIERQMTKIAHVHGISKIGNIDVPKPVYLNYARMTDGELSLQIMREKLVLFKSVHPESKLTREWQTGIELIDNAIFKGVHGLKGATWTPSYGVDLNKVKYAIQEAAKRFAPAAHNMIELVDRAHVGNGTDPLIHVGFEECKAILSQPYAPRSSYNSCMERAYAFEKEIRVLNEELENSAHHFLYEHGESPNFFKNKGYKNEFELMTKISQHKKLVTDMANGLSLSRDNVSAWADLGIRRRNSTKDLGSMSGQNSIILLQSRPDLGLFDKDGNSTDGSGYKAIGDFGLSAVIGLCVLIFVSGTAIAGIIQVIKGQEPTAFDYGRDVLKASFKPQGLDFAKDIADNIPTGGSGNGNGTSPTPCGEGMTRNATTGVCEADKKEGISTNLLIGGGLLLGGALLLSGNSK